MFVCKIAGINIGIAAPEWALHDRLESFLIDSEAIKPDVQCNVIFEKRPVFKGDKSGFIAGTDVSFFYNVGGSIHHFTCYEDDIPSYVISSSDWSENELYIEPTYNDPDDMLIVNSVREGIFSYLRNIVIAALAQRGGLLVHSSSIIWNNEAIVFSAPSGTGKSTHTNLWKQGYDVKILDGDITACRLVEGKALAYGLPWCGTSEQFINTVVPLRAIVFLEQYKENEIIRLDIKEAFMRLTARCLMLRWSDTLTELSLNTVQKLAESIDCYLLKCLPNLQAVELVKSCVEKK